MGASAKLEQKERLDVLKNEQAQHEPSTYHALANLNVDTGVTPSRIGKGDYVTGSEAAANYPVLPSGPWSSDYGRVPDEGPLGYEIGAQVPCGEPHEIAASLPATALISAGVGNGAECAPTLAATPSAEVVETSAPNSLISSASAADQASKGGGEPQPVHRRAPSPLTRPRRRL
jgi:hypothetical protein